MDLSLKNKHDERLDYVFTEGDSAVKRDGWVVILGHGLTGDKDRPVIKESADALSRVGFDTLCFSYSGNGDSEGDFRDATISKEADDLDSVITDLSERYPNIAYLGHSMGSAVGVLQVSRDPRVEALISLAGMLNTRAFAEAEFEGVIPDQGVMWDEPDCPLSSAFVKDLCETHANLADRVSEIKIPWLLIHGTEDDVVLPRDSEGVQLENATHIKIEGADHTFSQSAHMSEMAQLVSNWMLAVAAR